jgi:hypothetical protein
MGVLSLMSCCSSKEVDEFRGVGFQNRYYQVPGYIGSRVLEHNRSGRFQNYVEVDWTQAITVDTYTNRTWLVDRVYHQVLMVEPDTRYVPWPAYFIEYAGARSVPGHLDGSRREAKFNSPSGIAFAAQAKGGALIFVADTNNHCIRRISFINGQSTTIVGFPQRPGLRDGLGLQTRFKYPTSMGVDASGENLFVLDNGNRIRYVNLTTQPPTVVTLVGGACRTISQQTTYKVIKRTVGCHPDWSALEAGETDVQTASATVICIGHVSTCAPRDHPAHADARSSTLLPVPDELMNAGPTERPGFEASPGSDNRRLQASTHKQEPGRLSLFAGKGMPPQVFAEPTKIATI